LTPSTIPSTPHRLSHLCPVSLLIPYSLHSLLIGSSLLLTRNTNSNLWSITVSLFQGISVLQSENNITSETVRDVLITNCQTSYDNVHTEGRPYRCNLLSKMPGFTCLNKDALLASAPTRRLP